MSLMMLGFLTYLYRFLLLWFTLLFGDAIWLVIYFDSIYNVTGLVIYLVLVLGPISMGLYMWYLENKPYRPRIHI